MSESKIRVLDASLRLFASKGYVPTSMSDIANVLGIQKSSLYSHFKNKEKLFETILEHIVEKHNQTVFQLFETIRNETPLTQLERYFLEYVSYCHNNIEVDFWIRFYYFPPKELEALILSKTKTAENVGREQLRAIIEEGIERGEIKSLPAEDILLAYYQLLIGFLMSLNDYKKADPGPDMRRCLNIFFEGVRT